MVKHTNSYCQAVFAVSPQLPPQPLATLAAAALPPCCGQQQPLALVESSLGGRDHGRRHVCVAGDGIASVVDTEDQEDGASGTSSGQVVLPGAEAGGLQAGGRVGGCGVRPGGQLPGTQPSSYQKQRNQESQPPLAQVVRPPRAPVLSAMQQPTFVGPRMILKEPSELVLAAREVRTDRAR